MNTPRTTIGPTILAIAPSNKGFGFVFLEGARFLVDWGLKESNGNNTAAAVRRVDTLIGWYDPEIIILENHIASCSRRGRRVRVFLAAVATLARSRGKTVAQYSREQVRTCFHTVHARTKHDIAHAVAKYFPELRRFVPPVRKIWRSEVSRMSIFDATSLAITHFSAPIPWGAKYALIDSDCVVP